MVLKMADLDSGLGDRDVKQAFSQLAQANGMVTEEEVYLLARSLEFV